MPCISEWEALSQQLLLLFKVMLLHEGTGILPESDSESLGTSTSASSATSTLASYSSSSSTSSTSSRNNYDTAMGWPIIQAVSLLYANCYLNDCQVSKKCSSHLHMTLHVWRTERPENFGRHLHMWPEVFNAFLSAICHDNIFSNSSNNKQIDPREQLAVALYRMGHFRNAISMGDISLWAGIGYRTVDWCTQCFHCAALGTFLKGMCQFSFN